MGNKGCYVINVCNNCRCYEYGLAVIITRQDTVFPCLVIITSCMILTVINRDLFKRELCIIYIRIEIGIKLFTTK